MTKFLERHYLAAIFGLGICTAFLVLHFDSSQLIPITVGLISYAAFALAMSMVRLARFADTEAKREKVE